MPLRETSSYRPPFLLRNAHWQTVYPSLFRRVRSVAYERERFTLADGDFLELDWSRRGSGRLVIQVHGLTSCSEGHYMRGMCRAMNRRGADVLSMNLRGATGEVNRLARAYHSGSSDDLAEVLERACWPSPP